MEDGRVVARRAPLVSVRKNAYHLDMGGLVESWASGFQQIRPALNRI